MIVFISIILWAIIIYSAWNAPYGYEDENGFHYGKPEDKTTNKQ